MVDEPITPPTPRVAGVDAYRGLVMWLMMAEVLRLAAVSAATPGNAFWSFVAFHQTHVAWAGCSLHDLIQPSFSFLVGVALPFSLSSRRRKGQSKPQVITHAAWRALVLILLGVFLRSMHRDQTYWTFEDTLSQIGLGYLPLFLLGLSFPRWAWAAFTLIVLGTWGAFVTFPLPGDGFDYATVGVPPDWPEHAEGPAAHFNKNSNLAWAFDTWWLNLWPREEPFLFHRGGYATLSFLPTLATMILGLIAGRWIKKDSSSRKTLLKLVGFGLAGLALGYAAESVDLCPIVKRIWTPSWVLFSGGWCFLILAGFHAVCDVIGWTRWSFPLRVVGANSIFAYVLAHVGEDFLLKTWDIHIGRDKFELAGSAYGPFLEGVSVLLVYWLVLWWMWRRRLFIKI